MPSYRPKFQAIEALKCQILEPGIRKSDRVGFLIRVDDAFLPVGMIDERILLALFELDTGDAPAARSEDERRIATVRAMAQDGKNERTRMLAARRGSRGTIERQNGVLSLKKRAIAAAVASRRPTIRETIKEALKDGPREAGEIIAAVNVEKPNTDAQVIHTELNRMKTEDMIETRKDTDDRRKWFLIDP